MAAKFAPPLVCRSAAGPNSPSFSYFILPFAYSLRPGKVHSTGLCYKPAEPPDKAARLKYLTLETQSTLFERAAWFRLDGTQAPCADPGDPRTLRWRRFPAHFRDANDQEETREVAVGFPWLVLFELEGKSNGRVQATRGVQDDGLLRLGFMILPTQFEEAENAPPTLAHLLAFNEQFRYLSKPYPKHFGHFKDLVAQYPLTTASESGEMPLDQTGLRDEDWYSERWLELFRFPIKRAEADGHYACVPELGPATARQRPPWGDHADDRAFVWTCATVSSESLRRMTPPAGRPMLESSWWARLVNVDPPPDDDSALLTAFERQWIAGRTYKRWLHYDSLYGYCYHGGAHLRSPGDEPATDRHFATIYFDQVLLLLYLRVTTFRFSGRLSEIAARATDTSDEAFSRSMTALREEFAIFTSLYRYPLLTNQQQGVELYELAHALLDVRPLFDQTRAELLAMDELLNLKRQAKDAQLANRLNGLVFSAAALTLGVVTAEREPFTGWEKAIVGCLPFDGGLNSIVAFITLVFLLSAVYWAIIAAFVDGWLLRRGRNSSRASSQDNVR